MPFIANLLYQVEATGWVGYNNSNQNLGGRFNDTNSITNVALGGFLDTHTDYLTLSPVNPRASQHHVRNNFLRFRRQERLWCQYNSRNPLVNTQVFRRGQDRRGLVTQ